MDSLPVTSPEMLRHDDVSRFSPLSRSYSLAKEGREHVAPDVHCRVLVRRRSHCPAGSRYTELLEQ